MTRVYGLTHCDSCRKARRWLDARGQAHEFVDLRESPPEPGLLSRWLDAIGSDRLVNRRSTTWRQLDDAGRAAVSDDPVAALQAHPTLIKRPLLDTGSAVTVGFDAGKWQALLG